MVRLTFSLVIADSLFVGLGELLSPLSYSHSASLPYFLSKDRIDGHRSFAGVVVLFGYICKFWVCSCFWLCKRYAGLLWLLIFLCLKIRLGPKIRVIDSQWASSTLVMMEYMALVMMKMFMWQVLLVQQLRVLTLRFTINYSCCDTFQQLSLNNIGSRIVDEAIRGVYWICVFLMFGVLIIVEEAIVSCAWWPFVST